MEPITAFPTIHGQVNKEKFCALLMLRAECLKGFRTFFEQNGFTEVTVASIVNLAGSCENPSASFPIEVYGNRAYLSQSAQIQLEPLVLRLNKKIFTQSNSFRAEDYDDPESPGRRLSEFTLIEAEVPVGPQESEKALNSLLATVETAIKFVVCHVIKQCGDFVSLLGGDCEWLSKTATTPFPRVEYSGALSVPATSPYREPRVSKLGVKEERLILAQHSNIPTFVLHYPSEQKFFNIKRRPATNDSFSADLLMPLLGECVGAGIREECLNELRNNLLQSRLGSYLSGLGLRPEESFRSFFEVVESEQPTPRGGFGIGFERFIAALIQTNDIFDAITNDDVAVANKWWIRK